MSARTTATSSIVRRAARRRWWLVLAGACGVLLFQFTSGAGVHWDVLAEYVGLGSVATLGFDALARRGVKGMAAAISSLLLDLLLAVIPAALLELPGLGGLALVAMLPYAETEGGAFGTVAAVAAGLGLLLGHALVDTQPGLPTGPVFAEAVLVIILTFGLRSAGRRRAGRIEALRHAAERAAGGDFSTRLASEAIDPLGEVERGFDLLAVRTATTTTTLAREAKEVAALAEQLAASVEHLERAAGALSGASGRLAYDLQAQRSVAEQNRQQTEGAAHEAGEQRQRALQQGQVPRCLPQGFDRRGERSSQHSCCSEGRELHTKAGGRICQEAEGSGKVSGKVQQGIQGECRQTQRAGGPVEVAHGTDPRRV